MIHAARTVDSGQRLGHERFIERLSYAFQPVVNLHTGMVFGYEALLQGYTAIGFENAQQLLSYAQRHGFLVPLERALQQKAVAGFAAIPGARDARLLLNLDPRTLVSMTDLGGHMASIFAQHGLPSSDMCFELTEVNDVTAHRGVHDALAALRRARHLFAIDNFGAGYSGLRLLYELLPDLIKIDPFFITALTTDHRKRLFVASMVQLAHTLGIQTVAVGIETAEELAACRDVGCDFAQGFYIAPPSTETGSLRAHYSCVQPTARTYRRHDDNDLQLIHERIERLPTLSETDSMRKVFDYFKRHSERSFFPLLDHGGKPLGLICEHRLKSYIYSSYGRDLLANPAYRKQLSDFVSPCPVADIHSSAEHLLAVYAAAEGPLGIIMTDNLNYAGFLSQDALLKIIDCKKLATARDQNPLTRLPGNNLIGEYVARVLENISIAYCLVYFDFDHFKPFNDTYGFRVGDRAIGLFADLLNKHLAGQGWFIGHVGGDDFFAGRDAAEERRAIGSVADLIKQFRHEAESLYDTETRQRGYIEGTDREGGPARFPLLGCSAAMLFLPACVPRPDLDSFSRTIAKLKKKAKAAKSNIAFSCLTQDPKSRSSN